MFPSFHTFHAVWFLKTETRCRSRCRAFAEEMIFSRPATHRCGCTRVHPVHRVHELIEVLYTIHCTWIGTWTNWPIHCGRINPEAAWQDNTGPFIPFVSFLALWCSLFFDVVRHFASFAPHDSFLIRPWSCLSWAWNTQDHEVLLIHVPSQSLTTMSDGTYWFRCYFVSSNHGDWSDHKATSWKPSARKSWAQTKPAIDQQRLDIWTFQANCILPKANKIQCIGKLQRPWREGDGACGEGAVKVGNTWQTTVRFWTCGHETANSCLDSTWFNDLLHSREHTR